MPEGKYTSVNDVTVVDEVIGTEKQKTQMEKTQSSLGSSMQQTASFNKEKEKSRKKSRGPKARQVESDSEEEN